MKIIRDVFVSLAWLYIKLKQTVRVREKWLVFNLTVEYPGVNFIPAPEKIEIDGKYMIKS